MKLLLKNLIRRIVQRYACAHHGLELLPSSIFDSQFVGMGTKRLCTGVCILGIGRAELFMSIRGN